MTAFALIRSAVGRLMIPDHAALVAIDQIEDALAEACLHQGLPLDSTPESIAKHFRLNRELRERLEAHNEERS